LRNANIRSSTYFDTYGEPFGKKKGNKYDYGGRYMVSENDSEDD
jgi:hypothetical protein